MAAAALYRGGAPLDVTLHIALVIGIAMSADVLFAAVLGAAIPHFVKVMRIDPALISTPEIGRAHV